MKLPPKQTGPLPIANGDPVVGEYYECCNGLVSVHRPIRRIANRHKRRRGCGNPEVYVQYRTGPYHCVLRESALVIQHRGKYLFIRVESAITFAEAALPLLTFYGIDPTSDTLTPLQHNLSEVTNALDNIFTAVTRTKPTPRLRP